MIKINIQIFGKTKCFDTKKAERYFKERGISYHYVDILKKGLSRGEYESVKNAVGGMPELIDDKSKEYERQYIKYLARSEDIERRLFETPGMYRTPIVRDGRRATVGYRPDVWGGWE